MATIRKKDSESGGGQPIIPPNTGGGGVGVDPVIPPPVTVAPGSPFVPRPPTPPGQFTFAPASYQPFQQATGYGYDDWLAQMKDAFSMPSRGAGNVGLFGGNNLPRYSFGNRPGGMPPPSGFNASSFLAPYLAKMGGGTSGPPPGTGAGPPGGLLGGGRGMPQGPGGAGGLLSNNPQMAALIAQAMANSPAGGRTRG